MAEDRKQIDKIKATTDGLEAEGAGVQLIASVIERTKSLTKPAGDVLGMLGVDWLRMKRLDMYVKRFDERPEILEAIGSDPDIQQELSNIEKVASKASAFKQARQDQELRQPDLKVRAALVEAISTESNSELQEIWARLTDNATRPDRQAPMVSHIGALKQFGPEDKKMFEFLYFSIGEGPLHPIVERSKQPSKFGPVVLKAIVKHIREAEMIASPNATLEQLNRLGCIRILSGLETVKLHTSVYFSDRDKIASLASINESLNKISEIARLETITSTEFGFDLAQFVAE